jgi:hypothetical protein
VACCRQAGPKALARSAFREGVVCFEQALALKAAAARRRWSQIAASLMQSGKDPKGWQRPTVLERLRGWKRQAIAPQRAHRGDLRAAA